MDSINVNAGYAYSRKCWINKVPNDIFQYIFSLVDHCGMSVNLVCNFWKDRIIEIEKDKVATFNRFVKMCGRNSPLIQVNMEIDRLDLVQMVRMRHTVYALKQMVICKLKDLKTDHSKILARKAYTRIQGTFLEDIFNLAEVYKKLDRRMTPEDLSDAIDELLLFNDMEKALTIIKVQSPTGLERVINRTCSILALDGNLIEALQLAKLLKGKSEWESVAKGSIVVSLIRLGDIKKIQKVLSKMCSVDIIKVLASAYIKLDLENASKVLEAPIKPDHISAHLIEKYSLTKFEFLNEKI